MAVGAYPAFLILFLLVIVPLNGLIVGDERQELVDDIMARPELLSSIPFLLLVCLAIPVLEEFLFRGILYPGLRVRLSVWPAVLVSALIFALLHGLSAAIPILSFGCYLGLVRERNPSLLPAILVHAVHNSVTLLFLHLHLLQ
jgi:membrane protease YdiL (CAAX protease family)